MKRLQLGAVLVLWVAVAACAFSPVKKPVELGPVSETVLYDAPTARALEASRSALEAAGYEVAVDNKELRMVRSRPLGVAIPAVCNCGSWNGSRVGGTAFSVMTLTVEESGTGSALTMEHRCGTNFAGQNLYGATTRQESYECASKGGPEKTVFGYLDKLLGPGKAAPPKPACTSQEMAQMRTEGWSTERIRAECSRRAPAAEAEQ